MQIVRAAEWKPTPWKNGGGTTSEIAVSPAGAPLHDFSWRISAARVDRSGPFSIFPGIDRTLCILKGDGLELTGPEIEMVQLDQNSPPFSFPADSPVVAGLLGESILDLNVMTRRGIVTHDVQRYWLSGDVTAKPGRGTNVVLCLGDALTVRHSGSIVALQWGDAVIMHGADTGVTINSQGPTEIVQITLACLSTSIQSG
jgi:environmental stress-induced protein Ves